MGRCPRHTSLVAVHTDDKFSCCPAASAPGFLRPITNEYSDRLDFFFIYISFPSIWYGSIFQ